MKLRNFLAQNTVLSKLMAVLLSFIIISGLFSTPCMNFDVSAASSNLPEYDPNLGSYSVSGRVLTATPYKNCGFRGWYDKNGKEVAVTEKFTMPIGGSATDYIPVFYNYELIPNGDFENYEIGTDLKKVYEGNNIWNGLPDGYFERGEPGDWTSAFVSKDRAASGSKSLKIDSRHNTFYRTLYGLDTNTQYTLEFSYNIDPSGVDVDGNTVTPYMNYVAIFGDEVELAPRGNDSLPNFASVKFNEETGNCKEGEWKKVKLTFYTADTTDFKFAFLYTTDANLCLYLDDVSLYKDEYGAPTYANDDFSVNSMHKWGLTLRNRLTAYVSEGKLHTREPKDNYGAVQSPGFIVKKGFKYNITFKIDLSNVTDHYVQKYEGNQYLVDQNGNPIYEINSVTGNKNENWINFSLSTAKNEYGNAEAGTILMTSADTIKDFTCTATNEGNTVNSYVRKSNSSATGFSKKMLKDLGKLDPEQTVVITISFTAPKTVMSYVNIRLNGRGTYTIDDFVINESGSSISEDLIKSGIKSLGTAIRTSGVQGLRYKTKIDKRLLLSNKPLGVRVIEYGTVAIPTDALNGKELLLNTDYVSANGKKYRSQTGVAYSYKNNTDLRFDENDYYIHYTGVLFNIDEKDYISGYTTRAYAKYIDNSGKETVVYNDPVNANVFGVSKLAYSAKNNDGRFTETAKTREYLSNNILSKFTDKKINIKNASTPINTRYQGIRSTIYHCTTFFPDTHGRTYTEAEAAKEMDRLVDSKVDNVRTRFASQWMWSSGGWDWESAQMKAMYKWGKMLEERDISITIQAGWHMHDFIYYYDYHHNNGLRFGAEHTSIPEVHYLHGGDSTIGYNDLYGEDKNAAKIEAAGRKIGLELNNTEFEHYSVAAARYGEWIKQGVLQLKAHGINNVEYILPFTETGYERSDDPIYSYEEWTMMVLGLQFALEDAGIRKNYRIIGPSQSIYAYQNREWPFVKYLYSKLAGTEFEDMLDILAMHQYSSPNTRDGYANTIYDPYSCYSTAEKNFPYYQQILEESGVADKEFWCDEYFAHGPDAKWWNNVGMQMVQFAAGLTAGINNGVDRFLTWQMFDTLWDSSSIGGNAASEGGTGEFHGGVHAVGTCPSFIKADGDACTITNCACKLYTPISSYLPRVTYYGINLIGKYMNNDAATVFETSVNMVTDNYEHGLYVSAIKNDADKDVVLVVNTTTNATKVLVEFEKTVSNKFSRYCYDPEAITPTEEAISIPSDTTVECDGKTFFDTLPPRSFAIYVAN